MRINLIVIAIVVAISSDLIAQSASIDRLLFDDAETETPKLHNRGETIDPRPGTVDTPLSSAESDLRRSLQTVRRYLSAGTVNVATLGLQEQILESLELLKQQQAVPQPTLSTPNSNGFDNETDGNHTNRNADPGDGAGSIDDSPSDPIASQPGSDADRPENGAQRSRGDMELMDRAWGHLPPATVDRLRANSAVEFLPSYRDQIEAYFKRLADLPMKED